MLSYHPIAARVVKITITGKLSVAEESTKFSYVDSKNANLYSHSRKGFNSFLQIVYISHMTKQSYFYIFIGKKSYYSNKTLPMHIHSSCIYKHRNVESIQKSYSRWVIHTCNFSGEQEAAPRSLITETQSLRHSHSATLFARYIIWTINILKGKQTPSLLGNEVGVGVTSVAYCGTLGKWKCPVSSLW